MAGRNLRFYADDMATKVAPNFTLFEYLYRDIGPSLSTSVVFKEVRKCISRW